MAGLKKKAVKGVMWVSAGSFLTQVINLGVKIALARLLFPADFGLFAMAFILISFLNLFVGFGIGSAIIYRKQKLNETLNVAFIFSILVGVVVYVISFLSSGFIASFFSQPSLTLIIKIVSISFIIDSLVVVPHSVLSKKFYFKQRTIAETIPIFFYGFIAILLAFKGFGVWSLVIAYLIQHVIWMSLLWHFCSWRPNFSIDWKVARELFDFGKYVLSSSFLVFGVNFIDNLIIGRKLGDESLGYYSFAFNIIALPVTSFTHFVSGVFHPIYSKLQDNKERLRYSYTTSLRWVLIFVFPLAGGLIVLSDLFTKTVFGDNWLPMIIILQIFAVYPIIRSISSLSAYLLEGIGQPKKVTKILFIQLIILAVFIIPAVTIYGIGGVAGLLLISWFFSTLLFMHQVKKSIGITFLHYLQISGKQFLSAVLMALVVFLARVHVITSETLISFILLVILGAIVYFVTFISLERKIIAEAKEIMKLAF